MEDSRMKRLNYSISCCVQLDFNHFFRDDSNTQVILEIKSNKHLYIYTCTKKNKRETHINFFLQNLNILIDLLMKIYHLVMMKML